MSTPDARRTLDVREIDGEPFGDIVAALEELPSDDQLVLVAGFEPVPLYEVLSERGFVHETTQIAPDEFRVTIEHA